MQIVLILLGIVFLLSVDKFSRDCKKLAEWMNSKKINKKIDINNDINDRELDEYFDISGKKK